MSGDSTYIAKAAEDKLDAASNEQAQRWLNIGGRSAMPPEDAARAMIATIEEALANGATKNSKAMQRANALRDALIAGPSSPVASNGLRPFSSGSGMEKSILGTERADDMLPGDFDGTRQGVARALRADRWRRQVASADAAPPQSTVVESSQPPVLSSQVQAGMPTPPTREVTPSQPPLDEEESAPERDPEEEEEEDRSGGLDVSLDAKLDAIWSAGYAEPSGGE